jgi:ABC-type multidrug transport system fused ATPase/permease subunit
MTYLQSLSGNFWTVVIVLFLIIAALALIAFLGFLIVVGLNNWFEERAQKRTSESWKWYLDDHKQKSGQKSGQNYR